MPNCYSNLTLEKLQASHASIYAEPRHKWIKVGPHKGLPPAWREAVLMLQAIGEKVNTPLTWTQAVAQIRTEIKSLEKQGVI